MTNAGRHPAAATVSIIPLLVAATGIFGSPLGESSEAQWLRSLAFAVLTAAYAIWTRAGRRSDFPIFLLGAFALIPLFVGAVVLLAVSEGAGWTVLLFVTGVGYSPIARDAPLDFMGVVWWLSVALLVGVALLFRGVIVYFVLGETGD